MRFAAAAIAAASRDAIDTCAPSAASARATAKPSPLLAPPTIATLFVRPKSMGRYGTSRRRVQQRADLPPQQGGRTGLGEKAVAADGPRVFARHRRRRQGD